MYVDVIIVYSDSFETHLNRLRHVLNRLRSNGFVIQLAKCEFAKVEIIYLGYIISKKRLTPAEDKLDKIRYFPQPKDIKALRRFLGLCGYYRKFNDIIVKIFRNNSRNFLKYLSKMSAVFRDIFQNLT